MSHLESLPNIHSLLPDLFSDLGQWRWQGDPLHKMQKKKKEKKDSLPPNSTSPTHPHDVLHLYDFLSWVQHKKRWVNYSFGHTLY